MEMTHFEKRVLLEAVETFMELRDEDGGYIYNRRIFREVVRKIRDEVEGETAALKE